MIRLRWGHRRSQGRSADEMGAASLALEVDGVDVLSGGADEPVLPTTLAVLEAALALVRARRAAEVELEASRRRLCFWCTGPSVELRVLAYAPRLGLSRVIRVELTELAGAAAALGRGLCTQGAAGRWAPPPLLSEVSARVRALGALPPRAPPPPTGTEWLFLRPRSTGLGISVFDDCDRTRSWSRDDPAALTPLLVPGAVALPSGELIEAPPFFSLYAQLDPRGVPRTALAASAAATREAGLDLCLALVARCPALRANPWLDALATRCAASDTTTRPASTHAHVADERRVRPSFDPPLLTAGRVHRVGLRRRWSAALPKQPPGPCRLLSAGPGLILAGPRSASGISRHGRPGRSVEADGGVALAPSGDLLALRRGQLLALPPSLRSARWSRSASLELLGPELASAQDTLLAHTGPGALRAWTSLTGAERWRYEPRLARRLYVLSLARRLLLATDEALLLELDPLDGSVRRRVELCAQCQVAPVASRSFACFAVSGGGASILTGWPLTGTRQAAAAKVQAWTVELPLDRPRALAASPSRFFVAGERAGEAAVACVSEAGAFLWVRHVPGSVLNATLLPVEQDVVICDGAGSATRLAADGTRVWSTVAPCEPLDAPLPAMRLRRVLMIPGAPLRLVEIDQGREVGALDVGVDLSALAASRAFELFTYRASGLIEAWRPTTVMGLVGAPD